MAITVTVSDTPTYVTVQETTNNVILNRSDNPITVSTSLDLVQTEGSSDDITVTAHNNVYPTGNLTQALEKLADQFFRGTNAPTGSNLEEGDLWYDTDDNQLKIYRETSSGTFEFVPIMIGNNSADSDTVDAGSF